MANDGELIQIVDAAMAEAARLSGEWLVCRPGCADCCRGLFPITQLDAWRLRQGMRQLELSDPARAERVRERARQAIAKLDDYPGDPATGILDEGQEAEERFEALADDDYCPALDPETLTCDVYAWRPITCRVFGPAVSSADGEVTGACEKNYAGASDAEIAACRVVVDPEGMEDALLEGAPEQTIVAFALLGGPADTTCGATPATERRP